MTDGGCIGLIGWGVLIFGLFLIIKYAVRAGTKSPDTGLVRGRLDRIAAMPPTKVSQLVATGPGQYLIKGVDRETKMDTSWRISADSSENAKVKADLEGIIVTECVFEGP